MARFAGVTWGMVILLALGMAFGGGWAVAALLYITVFTFFMDKITALAAPDHPGAEFPAGDGLAVLLALAHFPLLYGGIAVLAGAMPIWEKGVLFVALALFLGQVSNSNAHELIHRSARSLRLLGMAVYSAVLFGHHASAHVRVHHVHAATDRDPNSARPGEGFWRFLLRAWRGELIEGYRAETRFRRGRGMHPYRGYGLGALASLGVAYVMGGGAGVFWLLALAAYAQIQLYLSDYVQHYGLRRREVAGRLEPVGPHHSWNSPHGFSSALMLNAPRHSDHHTRPSVPYPGLDLDREAMPVLPQSLPVMAVIALVPPLWRRMMDRRARHWMTTPDPLTTE
ncbi:alkane 1-monooxygenase [Pacificoceanicola onchidii]|uniref:alkane 1-monooxygenase n=1 Tax=Pacificoceanicola onchidii TaxID=2562685 RepID=UPI0010A2E1C5|nr:alkane 1-monooxygenase [Pacificoceanicola onchidii]